MAVDQPRLPRTDQPVFDAIRASGLSMSKVAHLAGVPYLHLRQAARGWARPSLQLRAKLPEILGQPIEALFDPASLVAPLASEACLCDTCTLKRAKRERALLTGGSSERRGRARVGGGIPPTPGPARDDHRPHRAGAGGGGAAPGACPVSDGRMPTSVIYRAGRDAGIDARTLTAAHTRYTDVQSDRREWWLIPDSSEMAMAGTG